MLLIVFVISCIKRYDEFYISVILSFSPLLLGSFIVVSVYIGIMHCYHSSVVTFCLTIQKDISLHLFDFSSCQIVRDKTM